MQICKVIAKPILIDRYLKKIKSPKGGALVFFLGTVRNCNRERKVIGINYSAYKLMTEDVFREISSQIRKRKGVINTCIVHRVGKLKMGETSVLVAVSSVHRKEAFEASRFAIDRLKKIAPIWKQEVYRDSKAWIS